MAAHERCEKERQAEIKKVVYWRYEAQGERKESKRKDLV